MNTNNKITLNVNQLHIRSFQPKDIKWVIQKHINLYKDEYGFDNTFKDYVATPLYKFQKSFNKEKENLWIAEVDGNVVGMIAIVKVDDKKAQLRWFLIDPEVRGKGLGHKLMQVALKFCKKTGYNSVFLWTISILGTARYLYKRYGFILTQTKEHDIWGKHLIEERWDLSL